MSRAFASPDNIYFPFRQKNQPHDSGFTPCTHEFITRENIPNLDILFTVWVIWISARV